MTGGRPRPGGGCRLRRSLFVNIMRSRRSRPRRREPTMKQYLLAVHMVEGDPAPSRGGDAARRTRRSTPSTRELQAAGAWVFAGGLHPPATATVVRAQGGKVVTTDGPFAETKEQLGGFWVIKAPDLDAALEMRRPAARPPAAAGRGPAVPGRAGRRTQAVTAPSDCGRSPASSGPSGRAPGARWPPWSASSATSTSPRRRSRRRSPSPPSAGPRPGCRPTRAAGSSPRRATRRSTGCGGSRPAPSREAQAAGLRGDRRARGGGTGARRPAAADLHLLPSGARRRGADRAHAAADRRAADARDRPRLPRPRADDRPAPRAGQAQDPGRGHPVPGAARRTSCPTGSRTCSRSSTWSSTRATRPPRATSLVRAGLCAEAIRLARLLAALMPDEPEVSGLLALLLLTEARRAARTSAGGDLVSLADQDRTRWDRGMIAEGQRIGPRVPAPQPAGPVPDPGRDQRRAQRRGHRGGDRLAADPRAVRPAAGAGADPGRRAEPRASRSPRCTARRPPSSSSTSLALDGYHLFHATRADLLRRLGRAAEAAAAYDAAIDLAENAAERRFLTARRDALSGRGSRDR